MNKITWFCLVFIFTCMCNVALSDESQRKIKISPLTPEQIKKALKQHDMRDITDYIVRDMTTENGKPSIILKGIRGGNDDWLDLFVQFRGASDAHWSEELDLAIGYAVGKNPRKALKAINDRYPRYALEVCNQVDEDTLAADYQDYGKYAPIALKELNKRIKSINIVTDNSLDEVKKHCLEALKKGEDAWKKSLKK